MDKLLERETNPDTLLIWKEILNVADGVHSLAPDLSSPGADDALPRMRRISIFLLSYISKVHEERSVKKYRRRLARCQKLLERLQALVLSSRDKGRFRSERTAPLLAEINRTGESLSSLISQPDN